MVVHNTRIRSAARSGFTLVEIMLVVIIIGIIAAFAVPAVGTFVEEARMQRAISDMQVIENNLVRYEAMKADYPDSLDAVAKYIKGGVVPDDPWGNPYKYSKSSNGFTLSSGGKSGSDTITSSSKVE